MRWIFVVFLFFCINSFGSITVPEIIVTPTKFSDTNLSQGQQTIITEQEMTETGATSLSELLQETGGVQLQDTTGNNSQVLLTTRGFGANASSNTLLLINGIPITNPDLAPPDLNAIPFHEIKAVEITSGSESVLYGDQAVGGTINILTKESSDEKIAITCAGGSYDARNCYASFNPVFRDLKLNFNLLKNVTSNYRVHNDYNQNLFSGNILYPYSRGHLHFDYQIANENMQYPGALTAAEVQQNRRQASNDTDFFRDWNGSYHLQGEQEINSNWLLDGDLSRREMHGDGVLTSPFNQFRVIHFFKPELKGQFGEIKSVSGMELENDHYHLSSLFGITDNSEQKYGIYTLLNIPYNNRLAFSAGVRGAEEDGRLVSSDVMTTLNRAAATTLGASYFLKPNLKIFVRAAGNYRFPKADENALIADNAAPLKTQRGISYETGTVWDERNFLTKFSVYQLDLRDEIQFNPLQTPEAPFGSNENLPPTTRTGFTLSEKYHATEKITVDGQYNYVNARFQNGFFAGNRIPLVSENIARGGIHYRFAEHWSLYPEAIYTGNQYAANDNANIGGKIGGYTVYNFSVQYYFKQFTFSFRLNNIFNKYYYFYTVLEPEPNGLFFYPAPGRNFLLTLKYAFV